MKRPRIGTKMFVIPNLIPAYTADKAVEVISFEQFSKGMAATSVRYNWPLEDIQNAVFIRLLEGPRAGTVSMTDPDSLLKKRAEPLTRREYRLMGRDNS